MKKTKVTIVTELELDAGAKKVLKAHPENIIQTAAIQGAKVSVTFGKA